MKVVTYFTTLCRLARAEHEAKVSGSADDYATAKAAHEAYRQQCLAADEMVIPQPPPRWERR